MRGGARKGAGRPPVPTGKAMKMRSIRMHDDEYEQVKNYIKKIREATTMQYKWEARLTTGTNYKVIDPPLDLSTKIINSPDDNGYVVLESDTFFSVLLFVGDLQVARLPAL